MNHDEVTIKVCIDQDLCTGDGLCEEICPSVFGMAQDGLAYVKEPEWPTVYNDGTNVYEDPILQMSTGLANVPASDVQAAIEAAEECPGECIFIEVAN